MYNKNMPYKKSPIDDFFFSLYGFYPTKAGQALELLATAALKIMNKDNKVYYDQYVKGEYSDQVYQIDGVIGEKSIEAKDHTIKNEKVKRPEVQNQEGGLVDLPYSEGIFASATGFTRYAKKYANGTNINPKTKKIDLYNIRPSTIEDEQGRVKTVILEFTVTGLNFRAAKITPLFTKEGHANMGKLFPVGEVSIKIDAIYNNNGSVFLTMGDWTKSLNYEHTLDEGKKEIAGNAKFEEKYLKINEHLIEIQGLSYIVPIQELTERIEIQQKGNACLYVRNEDGTVDTLLTDIQMKNVVFDKDTKEIRIGH
jgi:hypothetical protein